MFVVAGLHTKRRPHIGIDKSSARTRKQGLRQPPVGHPHQRLHTAKFSTSSSGQGAPRISEPRMTRRDMDARGRNDNGRAPPTKTPLGRVAPPRVRKFIPKPLILVERMKTRQLLLESTPPIASRPCIVPASLPKTATTVPPSTHVTPLTRQIPTCSTHSSGSASSVSVRVSYREGPVFGSGFGMMPPRARRSLSVSTLGDSSSDTDTFVADSPCGVKQAYYNAPLLVTQTGPPNVRLDVGSDFGKDGMPFSIIGDSGATDLVYGIGLSIDTFEPAMTSTPFTSSQPATNGIPHPTEFKASIIYPIRQADQIPVLSDSFENPRATYLFNASKDGYTVKLSNTGPPVFKATSATHANAPKRAPDFKRLSNRAASPSPTLVLDGVFALPRPSSSSTPTLRRTFHGFPRPRRPSSRRPFVDTTNVKSSGALALASESPSKQPLRSTFGTPTPAGTRPGPESPRSKLAHVLTARAEPQLEQTATRARRQARVPLLVRGIHASNDPRTQCEIEGLRVRRVVGLGRGGGVGGVGIGVGGGDGSGSGSGSGKGANERMSLAGLGMVAMLRARWEAGTVG